MSSGQWAALVAVVAAGAAAVVLVRILRSGASRRRLLRGWAGHLGDAPKVAVVVNASKLTDEDSRVALINQAVAARGWPEPTWHHTTIEDTGPGQGRQAVQDGSDLVLVLGGDGTVRLVAGELLNTGIALGLLPAGTGNLLARNLSLPYSDLHKALEVALGTRSRVIDAALAEIEGPDTGEQGSTDPVRQPFLVMAGLGFDAAVMATVTSELKERLGWMAYVVAGARNLAGRRTLVSLRLDDEPPRIMRTRSIVIGNCGQLTGGLRLLPDASVDDGWLDVVVVSPRTMIGWTAVISSVLATGLPARLRQRRNGQADTLNPPAGGTEGAPSRHQVVEHYRCRKIEVRTDKPLPVQMDGDPLGNATVLRAQIEPHSLVIKSSSGDES